MRPDTTATSRSCRPRTEVVLFGEVIHDARVIPMDGRPHVPSAVRSLHGDPGAVGRPDAGNRHHEVLAEELLSGVEREPSSIERFTRSAAETIDYEITVSDPRAWTQPWTALVHLKESSDRIFEYACHEGNDRTVTDMLLAARAAEKATNEVPANPK